MRIVAFHLLNDYSGSPKVLSQLLKGWTKSGIETHMVTCSGRTGFLSDIEEVNYHYYTYRFAPNPFVRLFNLCFSQFLVILKMLFFLKKSDVVYVNTVLPFGGAIIGKLKGCKVIYHVHETSMKPAILKRFLFGIVKWTANDVIYVSNYLANQEPISKAHCQTVYNAIEDDFLSTAKANRRIHSDPKNLLLVCSLKEYKGVNEFVALAKQLHQYEFRLVVNATQDDINQYFGTIELPKNLTIFATQTNLHPFYQWADLIVNFSKPEGWIETFGLTIIEGMAYGLPAIVPIVGGITELVEENSNGFKIDSKNVNLLSSKVEELFTNSDKYNSFYEKSLDKINQFNESTLLENINKIIYLNN
jgi:glycosyltransferase involved in cell wall biosynthesis